MGDYVGDSWPSMPDGTAFDGRDLLSLVVAGRSPFLPALRVSVLIQEIERVLGTTVVDIPVVTKGSNNYVSEKETAPSHT